MRHSSDRSDQASIRRPMACSLVLLLATLIAGPATANDNGVAAGRALVEMYCTDCHATGPTGDSPLSIAPRFRDLYLRYNVEHLSEALVEGIVTAHPDMPPFEFDPEQAEAIIVYLKTLEPVPPAGDPAKADE